jgi:hypothetical protein
MVAAPDAMCWRCDAAAREGYAQHRPKRHSRYRGSLIGDTESTRRATADFCGGPHVLGTSSSRPLPPQREAGGIRRVREHDSSGAERTVRTCRMVRTSGVSGMGRSAVRRPDNDGPGFRHRRGQQRCLERTSRHPAPSWTSPCPSNRRVPRDRGSHRALGADRRRSRGRRQHSSRPQSLDWRGKVGRDG